MRRPLLLLCVCLFVLSALGMQITNAPPWDSELAVATGEKILVVGQVYEKEYRAKAGEEIILFYLKLFDYSKEANASNQNFYQQIDQKRFQHKTKIICEVSINDLPTLGEESVYMPKLGETIVLTGSWQEFSHATNPGEFDMANYYAMEGIIGKIRPDRFLSSDGKEWSLREMIFQVRQKLLANLYHAFEQEDAAILAKMLLGDGSGLDKEIRDLYQSNGIVHILSISGLHISMIGMGIYNLLRKGSCPLGIAAVLGGIFIIFYGVLTGFGVSSCRAIGMYLIRMLGEIWGKTYDMLTAMGVLAILLVWENPRLVYHSGYLLSFTSVCGVGLLAPILPRLPVALQVRPYDADYRKMLKRRAEKVWSGFSVSLAVTLFTLPIQLFFFYKIPVYSVWMNLLVIPLVSVVMVIGFVVMLLPGLGFLCPIESMIFAWFEWLCHTFEMLPGHTWVTGRPQMWKILVYYVVMLGMILWKKHLKNVVVYGTFTILVLFVGTRIQRENIVMFLDVGQGDCICVQTSTGECYLFDGGSSSKSKVGEKIILPYLQYCGITHIDALFISHPDEDHVNGLEELFVANGSLDKESVVRRRSELTVERLILPAVAEADKEFAEILSVVDGNVTAEYVASGESMRVEEVWWNRMIKYLPGNSKDKGIQITCLHPKRGYTEETNAYSACYLLEIEDCRILLTGDVEGSGEDALTRELKRRGISTIDVLKVAHHGSRYSTTQDFLNEVNVQLAVISCGKRNSYGHPHEETLERLAAEGCIVATTPQCGSITIEIDSEEGFTVSCWENAGISD